MREKRIFSEKIIKDDSETYFSGEYFLKILLKQIIFFFNYSKMYYFTVLEIFSYYRDIFLQYFDIENTIGSQTAHVRWTLKSWWTMKKLKIALS